MDDVSAPAEQAADEAMDFVIVTGMSGAGRTTTANVLEDHGWYVVDNLPLPMLLPLVELAEQARGRVSRVAAVVDVRSRPFSTDFQDALRQMQLRGWRPRVVFMDATDEALVRRFESVRRPHPLQGEGRMLEGIIQERQLLRDLRSGADLVVDTSGYNVHQLTAKIDEILGTDDGPRLRVAVMSFGFKYGIPLDADIVLDLRFLPNPFWVPSLRPFTGRDEQVRDYVLGQEGAAEFLDRGVVLLAPMLDGYLRQGRRHVTVALGCTGGKHRSVVMAEELAARLQQHDDVGAATVHRDLGRE